MDNNNSYDVDNNNSYDVDNNNSYDVDNNTLRGKKGGSNNRTDHSPHHRG